MALSIKSEQADRLARELSSLTGESLTKAVTNALIERLKRFRRKKSTSREEELRAIQERAARIPSRDDRPIDEILGYNQDGTFE
tara:strand:+ start:64 stop:315 length:252 start_codon:yes stop_codon:yes gene_type:complete